VRVLILGGGGQVARALLATAPARHDVAHRARAQLDIADPAAVAAAIAATSPDWIVNGAAYTAVDRGRGRCSRRHPCQRHRGRGAGRRRWQAPVAASSTCRRISSSTAMPAAPISRGPNQPPERLRQDEAGGRAPRAPRARRHRAAHRVGVCGRGPEFRAHDAAADAREGPARRRCRPDRHAQLGERNRPRDLGHDRRRTPGGIYHWTDLGVASWYDFAVAIQEEALARGLLAKAVPIAPIATADYPTRAIRPRFSVLDSRATRALIPVAAQHWRQHLREMLDELRTP
jgi:dTDP-4-dehydrorhamnose reductase